MYLSTTHAASSYGQPVLVSESGTAYGPGDAPDLFGASPAQQVDDEMLHWARSVAIALGFGPWQAAADKLAPPYDPVLADRFCALAGMPPRWAAFAKDLRHMDTHDGR